MAVNGLVENMGDGLLQRGFDIGVRLRQIPARVWRQLLIGLLTLWLVYSLSQLFWLLMPEPDIATPSLATPSNISFTQSPDNGQSAVDIATIKKLMLFGDASAVPVEAPVAASGIEDSAVATNLQIDLVHTTVGNPESKSFAVVAHRGTQKAYHIGEQLDISPSGVKLAKVLTDRIILDNRGTYESKFLFGESGVSVGNRAGAARTVARNRPAPPMRVEDPVQDYAPEATQDMNSVEQLVEAVAPEEGQIGPTDQQVKAITDVVKVQMHRENGEFIGFKIRPGRNRELFESLGLQPNDVVVAVNGTRLTDTQSAMEEYRSLGKSTQATLDILREGYSQTVTINLDSN